MCASNLVASKDLLVLVTASMTASILACLPVCAHSAPSRVALHAAPSSTIRCTCAGVAIERLCLLLSLAGKVLDIKVVCAVDVG